MNILVTGGTGFIGSAFVRQLLAEDHAVAILSRRAVRLPVPTRLIEGSMEAIPWDHIDSFQPEICVHCAWITTPGEYLTSPANETLLHNSLDLAAGLSERGLRRFVGLGTCLEYPSSPSALSEDSPLADAGTPYARAKRTLHAELNRIFPQTNRLTWIRIFYAYGPGEDPQRFISTFFRKAAGGESFELRRPDDVVDYIHVEDIASALRTVALSPYGGTFNIGSGSPLTLRTLAETLERVSGHRDVFSFAAQCSVESRVADIARLAALGWKPSLSLPDGIRTMIAKHP